MGFAETLTWVVLKGKRAVTGDNVIRLSSQEGWSPYIAEIITDPGTTLTTAIDVRGAGFVLFLNVLKPTTTNAVALRLRMTVDDSVLLDDVLASDTQTAAQNGQLVGGYTGSAGSSGPIAFLPFNTSFKLEVRFSSDPGGLEDITVRHFLSYVES